MWMAKGDYFGMNCQDLVIEKLSRLVGNYSFDGVKNMEVQQCQQCCPRMHSGTVKM